MIRPLLILVFVLPALSTAAQETHDHPAPEKLGTVSFLTTCEPEVQQEVNRAVAMLHSFAYKPAEQAFHSVVLQDPHCAITHWGSAMTQYHQLWDLPPSPADTAAATQEIEQAVALQASERESGFIHALSLVFRDAVTVPYSAGASNYESAMRALTAANPEDLESQIFFALALISNASPSDREHRLQKQAVEVLEPLFRRYRDHPGISHCLIHARDNQEPALHGLPAARVYAGVALFSQHPELSRQG